MLTRTKGLLVCLTVALCGFAAATDVAFANGTGKLTGPVYDNTARFFPQVNENLVTQSPIRPSNPRVVPRPVTTADNGIPVSSLVDPTSTTALGAKFPGVNYTFYEPADPNIAVGPGVRPNGSLIQVVNSSIAFFTKGGVKTFEQPLQDFFSGVAQTTFVFDPKCVYDQAANRYYVVALEFRQSPKNSGILLAVSDNSTPEGNWTKYRIDALQFPVQTSHWFDYPGLGYNKDGIVITGNMFSFSGNAFQQARSYAIKKADLLTGGTAHFSWFDHSGSFTIMPTRVFESVSTRVFGVSVKNSATFTFYAWSSIAGTPTVAKADVTVPSFNFYTSNPQSTGGSTLDAVADRMMDAMYRSGFLVCAHTVKVSSTDNRAMVRWYEFKTNSWPSSGSVTRRQSGNVALAAPNNLYMPAISRNGSGALTMILTRSSNTRTADLYALSHKSTAALNTFGPLSLVASSLHNPNAPQNRWGDYFSIANDPTESTRFWGCGMVLRNDGNWRTEIGTWLVP